MGVSDEETQAVISAMENPEHTWRTVPGISKETGLSPQQVIEAIDAKGDEVVRFTGPDDEHIYTTREQYRKNTGAGERLLGAIKNRVA